MGAPLIMLLETIGWLGSVCMALRCVPQVMRSFRKGNSKGLSYGLILLWLFGGIFTLIYVVPTGSLPLIFNYSCNIILILILLWYKVFPNKDKKKKKKN